MICLYLDKNIAIRTILTDDDGLRQITLYVNDGSRWVNVNDLLIKENYAALSSTDNETIKKQKIIPDVATKKDNLSSLILNQGYENNWNITKPRNETDYSINEDTLRHKPTPMLTHEPTPTLTQESLDTNKYSTFETIEIYKKQELKRQKEEQQKRVKENANKQVQELLSILDDGSTPKKVWRKFWKL